MFIVICGAGKVGASLARKLADENHKIVVVEKNKDLCERLAEKLSIIVINGDACEPRYLEEAQADHADVVVAVTGDDEDNLVICQLAKTYYSVKRTVARVNDPRNEHTFAQLGVDVPVNATNLIAQVINQEVSLDELSTLLKLKQGKVSLIQGTILQGSPLVNMELKDIPLPEDCIIVSVLRGDDVILPRGATRLEEKDQLLAVMTAQNEKIFNNLLVG